jgi:hypothetical protein
MAYEYDNTTEYLFDKEIDKMNEAEQGLKQMTNTATKALNLDPSKEMTEIDKARQTALDRTIEKFTKDFIENGHNPNTYSGKYDFRRTYCQSLANQLDVGYAWTELNGSESMYDHRELQPATTNAIGKPVSPRIAYYQDVTEYGPSSFTFVDAMSLTQDQYDKLKIVQQDKQALNEAFEPQSQAQKSLAKGEYELVQNKRGEPYIHGKPDFENAPEDVYFKPTYGMHQFSDQEVKSLLKGEELSIPMRSGEGNVKLGEGKIGDHEYFGVQRTDITKERPLPNIPDVQASTPETQNSK